MRNGGKNSTGRARRPGRVAATAPARPGESSRETPVRRLVRSSVDAMAGDRPGSPARPRLRNTAVDSAASNKTGPTRSSQTHMVRASSKSFIEDATSLPTQQRRTLPACKQRRKARRRNHEPIRPGARAGRPAPVECCGSRPTGGPHLVITIRNLCNLLCASS